MNIILDILEKYYIRKYNSRNEEFGYNLAEGGRTNRGYHHSEEYKKALSLKEKGRKMSPQCIEKMRIAHLGIPRTEEVKRKVSEARNLKIYQYDLNNNLVCEWKCAKEASLYFKCSRANINDKVRFKKLYKGFIFTYNKINNE